MMKFTPEVIINEGEENGDEMNEVIIVFRNVPIPQYP